MSSRAWSSAALASLAAFGLALLLASPASGAAVESEAPTAPTDLFNGYSTCATDVSSATFLSGTHGVVIEGVPQGSDSSGGADLSAQYRVWSVSDQTHSTTLSHDNASAGFESPATVPSSFLVDGQTYAWQAWSVVGSENSDPSQTCYFTVDDGVPSAAPAITSSNYPEDQRDPGGEPVQFTLDANGVGDVAGFVFDWQEDLSGIATGTGDHGIPQPHDPYDDQAHFVRAGTLGGSATVSLIPPGRGLVTLWVASLDRANNRSDESSYEFSVASTAPTVAASGTPQFGTPTTFVLTPDPHVQATSPVVSYSVQHVDGRGDSTIQVAAAADGTAEVTLVLDGVIGDDSVLVTSTSANGWVTDAGEYDTYFDTTPTVTSDVYAENASSGGVGVPGTFTFAPKVPGVVSYTYSVDWGPSTTVTASSDHSSTINWTPTESGSHDISVYATTESGADLAWYDYFFTVN